jgi:hypothetical protein
LEEAGGEEAGTETGTQKTGRPGSVEEVCTEAGAEAGRKTGAGHRDQAEEGRSGDAREAEGGGAEGPDVEARRAQVGGEGGGEEGGHSLEARRKAGGRGEAFFMMGYRSGATTISIMTLASMPISTKTFSTMACMWHSV